MEKDVRKLSSQTRVAFAFNLVLLFCLFRSSDGSYFGVLTQSFTVSENRALKSFTYQRVHVSSRVRCVRNCHADYPNCKSVNYDDIHHLCELNNATWAQCPDNLIADFGSVYYDGNVDTPLLSHAYPDTTVSSGLRYSSCQELLDAGQKVSGVFTIFPARFANGLQVYCDMETDGEGWIVIQRRQDGSVDFYRDWADYRAGFGNLSGEFWLGNDFLRSLTESDPTWQLRVDILDWNAKNVWAVYGDFRVTGEEFQLHVGLYNDGSTAGNAFMYTNSKRFNSPYLNNGMHFTTKDNDNDQRTTTLGHAGNELNCAVYAKGGWWYNNCLWCNLNGVYYHGGSDLHNSSIWYSGRKFGQNYEFFSIKECTMKIRHNV